MSFSFLFLWTLYSSFHGQASTVAFGIIDPVKTICLQLLNNELYFVAIRIFTCNLSTGEIKYYDYQLVDFGSGNHIQALFTDGKNVYVVMQTYGQDRL